MTTDRTDSIFRRYFARFACEFATLLISFLLLTVLVPPAQAQPANNNFSNRTTVTSAGATVTATNTAATKEAGEPNHAGNAGGTSAWWSWTPTDSGTATIDTTGSTFDTLLAVYTGTNVANLTLVASNDDWAGKPTSQATFTVKKGTNYVIAVDGYGGNSGIITLTVTAPPVSTAATNDNFASRITIAAAGATVTGSNTNATKEAGEPNHAGNAGGKSVWWSWTPTISGTATIETTGSSFDTLLAIYRGTNVSKLTPVASKDDWAGVMTSLVTFQVTAGTNYVIAVDGYGGTRGAITLIVTPPTPTVAAPVFNPPPGASNSAIKVTITSATAGATIRYSISGIDPSTNSTLYTGPITISSGTVLKARAYKSGSFDSAVTTGVYFIGPVVATPVLSPASNTTFVGSIAVNASTTTSGATLRYTTNGTVPIASSAVFPSAGIVLFNTTTVRVRGFAPGKVASGVVMVTVTRQAVAAAAPVPASLVKSATSPTGLILTAQPLVVLLAPDTAAPPTTWDEFLDDAAYFNLRPPQAPEIFKGMLAGGAPLTLDRHGVGYYRLRFQPDQTGEGGQAAQDVRSALSEILALQPGAKILLVGQARGGLAGHDFLESASDSPERAAVVGLVAVGQLDFNQPETRMDLRAAMESVVAWWR